MPTTEPIPHSVSFSGRRLDLAFMLLRGYALMVPTIGLNRFWLTTSKRRFYWGHTALGGDALEYTGNAQQLLVGFLMALAVFLPLYGLFFFLSTQSMELAITGYGCVAVGIWFLTGYAVYRARDFRLSRTLWRGIRFDLTGNPWGYGARRFFWSLLNVATLGLAYPFMSANLWAYRYRHTWFGDRAFSFAGSWKRLALPYYGAWLIGAGLVVYGIVIAEQGRLFEPLENYDPDPGAIGQLLILGLILGILITIYRAAEMTRMFSAIRLGDAALTVRIGAFDLIGQYALFGLALIVAYLLLAAGGAFVLGLVAPDAFAGGGFDFSALMRSMQSSVTTLLAIVLGYLLLFAAFSFVSELFLGFGFWRLVCKRASVNGLETLADIRARAEDKALAGEGLADALNVGGY